MAYFLLNDNMKYFRKNNALLITLLILTGSVVIFVRCVSGEEGTRKNEARLSYSDFAGAASCAGCHKDAYNKHLHSAHYLTSAPANDSNILGSFADGQNTYTYSNGGTLHMEKRADGFYQVMYVQNREAVSQRFDIVTGSGKKGQTYLHWKKDTLVQLPVSYFTMVHQWANSPANPDRIAFNRPITSRCLECHTTFARKTSEGETEPETYDQTKFVYGVDCEKCHGPAARHVAYQTSHPDDKKAQFILNPSNFTRNQSLDLCALCHGGRLQKSKPSFSFMAGDRLSDYFVPSPMMVDGNALDVHGNQFGLLASSKCFVNSKTMTCLTCHDAHANESGQTALFASRCRNCHNKDAGHTGTPVCKLSATEGKRIDTSCTDCHMPALRSHAIALLLQGQLAPTPAVMHTHLIRNYPDETQKVLALLKKKG